MRKGVKSIESKSKINEIHFSEIIPSERAVLEDSIMKRSQIASERPKINSNPRKSSFPMSMVFAPLADVSRHYALGQHQQRRTK